MEEDAIGTLIGGKAKTTRRFSGQMCEGVLTKTRIYHYWGDALENLVQAARDIHKDKKHFYVEKMNKQVSPADCNYELAIVSYPGSGKYKKHGNCQYVPFHEVPDRS